MLLEALGNRIRVQREKRGLKQLDIANALHISPQAVSKWERGENAPDIAILGPLARLLGVSTDWLLSAHDERRDVFEATVLTCSVHGAYKKSIGMAPRDFAAWLNGLFVPLTELTLRHDGVPVKYIGDGFLCFFSGVGHRDRAVRTALGAKAIVSDDLRIGLASGHIYLGSVGHPDYARPDIMGEVVNIAFLTMEWAQSNTQSGVAATVAAVEGLETSVTTGRQDEVNFKGISHPARVCEITAAGEDKAQ